MSMSGRAKYDDRALPKQRTPNNASKHPQQLVVAAAATGSSSTSQTLAVRGGQLMISACGRTVAVDAGLSSSLLSLQTALQGALQMDGQLFHFFDVHGSSLETDKEVQEACAQGRVPLCATLTDASIHFIENRREELAQMQWKLVRDQLTGTTGKIASLSRLVKELEANLDTLRSESASMIERGKQEVFKAIEAEREITNTEIRQIYERMTGIGQLINSERTKREIGIQNQDKNVQALRDLHEAERASRKQDWDTHTSHVSDIRNMMESERSAREAFQDMHTMSVHGLQDRFDGVTRHHAEMIQDHSAELKRSHEVLLDQVQGVNNHAKDLHTRHDSILSEANARFCEIEDRCRSIESKVAEAASRQAASFDKLCERHEKVSQAVVALNAEEKLHKGQMQSTLERVKSLEAKLIVCDGDTRDLVLKERERNEGQVMRFHQTLQAQQEKRIGELEKNLGQRMELASKEREQHVNEIFDDLNMPKRESQMAMTAPLNLPISPGGRNVQYQEGTVHGSVVAAAPQFLASGSCSSPLRRGSSSPIGKPQVVNNSQQSMVMAVRPSSRQGSLMAPAGGQHLHTASQVRWSTVGPAGMQQQLHR
jgi:hypothetical protein